MSFFWNRLGTIWPWSTWRQDLAGLCLLIAIGIPLRSTLIPTTRGAAIVTLLIEPAALLIVLFLRPLLLDVRDGSTLLRRALLANIVMCVAAAGVLTTWAKFVTTYSGHTVPSWSNLQSWVAPCAYYTIVFASWGLAHFWISAEIVARNERQRAIAAEAEALKAELHHLRHQLDPHFLFNALNGIATEIPHHPKAAVVMVRELADYLRYSLDQRNMAISPFFAEIDAARSYLEVQKARFGRDLQFHLNADKMSRAQVTPPYLLQPLIENAVKHGLKTGIRPLDIAVEATSDGLAMSISVSSNGTLRDDWRTSGNPGVGLSVLQRRLELHYPERHSFDMNQNGDRVIAEIRLQGAPCSA